MKKYQTIAVSIEGVLMTTTWTREAAAEQDYRRKLRNKQQYRYICLAKQTWNTGNGTLTNAIIEKEYINLINDKNQCKDE